MIKTPDTKALIKTPAHSSEAGTPTFTHSFTPSDDLESPIHLSAQRDPMRTRGEYVKLCTKSNLGARIEHKIVIYQNISTKIL